ncbi:MAG TPA: response regulator [Candidatus Acidoferrales bacterium]|nr:response regulator [Candidatus Acidoferrales bacterium]
MPTILVADDNSNIQKMVSLVFEEKGNRVVAVGNGEAACRKVAEVHPDIVLADVFMPVRNGYEVCEFVKQDSQFAAIPVILLVGAFDPLDEKEAQRVGADGVLKKPFVPPDPLIAMVTSLLPKTAPPEPEPVKEEVPVATIQQPPPPILPARAPYVPSEPEETTPEEFTFGMAPRDSDADDPAPVFGKSVTTPAAKHVDEDDYEEPASEWKRRRSTMEYDIPAAESASMVEKLAGGKVTPDDETLETSVRARAHVPFGGANVPEKIESSPASSPTEWMDLMGAAETETAEPVVEESLEASAPVASGQDEKESSPAQVLSEPPIGSSKKYAITRVDDSPNDAPHEVPQQHNAPEPKRASTQQTEWSAPSAEVIPFRLSPEISTEKSDAGVAAHEAQEPASYSGEGQVEAQVTPETAAPQRLYDIPYEARTETPVVETSANEEAQEEQPSEVEAPRTESDESALSEAISTAAAKSAKTDSASVDSVVAKLLEKLEPQIHEALSNGVLRPLVEEILNRERGKK